MAFTKSSLSFVRSNEDLSLLQTKDNVRFDFYQQKMLMVYWLTHQDVVERVIPQPLQPVMPMAVAYIAEFPRTNFCEAYMEGALFVPVTYNGEFGLYCLSMPLDGINGTNPDIPIFCGRAVGYPKKQAKVRLDVAGKNAQGSMERHGIRFVEISADLNGKLNDTKSSEYMMIDQNNKELKSDVSVFNFKYDLDVTKNRFDICNLKLIQSNCTSVTRSQEIGEVDIKLTASVDDPWAELEVVKPLGAVYEIRDLSMVSYKVTEIKDSEYYLPYALKDWDAGTANWLDPLF